MTTRQPRRPEQGFSLIEIMVGVVIGLIAVLVIYQVFAAAEGIKRNTTSVGDAQQNGLLSSFMLGIELANAGNGVASAQESLVVAALKDCPGGADFASTWRPIPVMIVDGGGANIPDTFMVSYSVATGAIAPMPFWAPAAAVNPYQVQSPTGFQAGDLIIAIAKGSPGSCAASIINQPVAITDVLNGVVTVNHTNPVGAGNFDKDSSTLFDMGPSTNAQKVRYDVTNAGVLRTTALLMADATPNDDTAPPPNPLASNVVNLKLQYGIVPLGGGPLQWKTADAFPWRPVDLLSGLSGTDLVTNLKTLRAVRIGIVVRGEQWDKDGPDVPWSLFGGVYSGTFVRVAGNYRYRTYETVIPLRNELWNSL